MVMIDMGASYNFININFIEKKDLKIKGFKDFRVSNVNGKLILVDQIMERLGVTLQVYVVRDTHSWYTRISY